MKKGSQNLGFGNLVLQKSPRFAKLSDVIDDPVGRQRGQLSRRRWRGDLEVILGISLVSFDAARSTVCGN